MASVVRRALTCCASSSSSCCCVSLCRCGHCVIVVVTPWHWPSASWWHRRVVHCPSTSCIVHQCVMHQCVMHPASCVSVSLMSSCRRGRRVVDIVTPWHWPSASCHCHHVAMSSLLVITTLQIFSQVPLPYSSSSPPTTTTTALPTSGMQFPHQSSTLTITTAQCR